MIRVMIQKIIKPFVQIVKTYYEPALFPISAAIMFLLYISHLVSPINVEYWQFCVCCAGIVGMMKRKIRSQQVDSPSGSPDPCLTNRKRLKSLTLEQKYFTYGVYFCFLVYILCFQVWFLYR